MPVTILTRRETFSASHRLISPLLSEKENEAMFGKCYRPNGHGHNYVVEVSVRGKLDEHGILINTFELERIIKEHVLSKVDHRHLNLDIPEFSKLNPTVENIAIVIWGWLKPALGDLLYEVHIQETEKNSAIYRGE